ncbi:MAG TPA: alpha/beta fold hydrolase [Thermoanaerobaculia bacterium]|nr:alpha/beta fold hydrolase [Thermoanaerobaculia bacterium]
MRLAALFVALFTAGCCTSLPRLPSKRVAFPAPHAPFGVIETTGQLVDAKRERAVPIHSYSPSGSPGPFPVVLFSHGIGEDRDSYAYLGRALARAGFYTIHLTHAGTDKATLQRGYRALYRATKEKENWINRALDVSFVLDQFEGDPALDLTRVAVVGHSAGAFTAFAVAGMRAPDGGTLRDPRVKVIVPMSMVRIAGNYDAIDIPVLNLTGTCDTSLIYRTFPRHRRIPFESSRGPHQYLVTLQGVNHNMFSAAEDPHHARIAAITVAFLRAWMENDAAARAWFDEAGRGDGLAVEHK